MSEQSQSVINELLAESDSTRPERELDVGVYDVIKNINHANPERTNHEEIETVKLKYDRLASFLFSQRDEMTQQLNEDLQSGEVNKVEFVKKMLVGVRSALIGVSKIQAYDGNFGGDYLSGKLKEYIEAVDEMVTQEFNDEALADPFLVLARTVLSKRNVQVSRGEQEYNYATHDVVVFGTNLKNTEELLREPGSIFTNLHLLFHEGTHSDTYRDFYQSLDQKEKKRYNKVGSLPPLFHEMIPDYVADTAGFPNVVNSDTRPDSVRRKTHPSASDVGLVVGFDPRLTHCRVIKNQSLYDQSWLEGRSESAVEIGVLEINTIGFLDAGEDPAKLSHEIFDVFSQHDTEITGWDTMRYGISARFNRSGLGKNMQEYEDYVSSRRNFVRAYAEGEILRAMIAD